MSEKIQEFLEIPQEFVREGNQVRRFRPCNAKMFLSLPTQFLVRCTKPSQKGLCAMLLCQMEHRLMCFFAY